MEAMFVEATLSREVLVRAMLVEAMLLQATIVETLLVEEMLVEVPLRGAHCVTADGSPLREHSLNSTLSAQQSSFIIS
jgi:hypothetical protein